MRAFRTLEIRDGHDWTKSGSHFFSVQMKARSSPEWTTSIDGGFMNLCG